MVDYESRLSNSLDAGLRVWDINAYFEGENRCLKLMSNDKKRPARAGLFCASSVRAAGNGRIHGMYFSFS